MKRWKITVEEIRAPNKVQLTSVIADENEIEQAIDKVIMPMLQSIVANRYPERKTGKLPGHRFDAKRRFVRLNELLAPKGLTVVYQPGSNKNYALFEGQTKMRGWATLKNLERYLISCGYVPDETANLATDGMPHSGVADVNA